MKGVQVLASSFYAVQITGPGMVAFSTSGPPLTFMAGPSRPLATDPEATVAWSANLKTRLRTDISLRNVVAGGTGGEFQMVFEGPGEGFVILQPSSEVPAHRLLPMATYLAQSTSQILNQGPLPQGLQLKLSTPAHNATVPQGH